MPSFFSVLKNFIRFTYSSSILGPYCVQVSLLGCHGETAMNKTNDLCLQELYTPFWGTNSKKQLCKCLFKVHCECTVQEGCRFLCECAWTEPSLVGKPGVGARSGGRARPSASTVVMGQGLEEKRRHPGQHEAISRCRGCGCQQQKPPELSTLIPRSHS